MIRYSNVVASKGWTEMTGIMFFKMFFKNHCICYKTKLQSKNTNRRMLQLIYIYRDFFELYEGN